MKKTILFLCLILFIISFNTNVYAIQPVDNELVVSKKDIEQDLGRKLTLKEVIGLSILQKTLKKSVKKKRKKRFEDIEECAKIVLKSGEQLKVKIQKLTVIDITYSLCDDAEQNPVSTPLSEIDKIRSAEGLLVYESQVASQDDVASNLNRRKRTDPFAILSFIFSLTIYLIPVGFVFGLVSLRRIKKYPDFYKGKTFALIGTIISAVISAILLLSILLLAFL